MVFDILPHIPVSYVVSVRQASVLSQASFRHSLTGLPLPLTNTSPYRAYEGLSPSSISALPGAQKKREQNCSLNLFFLLIILQRQPTRYLP
jgi:hypothetical protein